MTKSVAKKPYARPTSHTSPAEIQNWIDECKRRDAAKEELASGPWTTELVKSDHEFWSVHDKDGWPVQSNEKNVRLMAAAPDLLKALQEISDRIDELEAPNHRAIDFVELRGLQETAEIAIHKAKGKL